MNSGPNKPGLAHAHLLARYQAAGQLCACSAIVLGIAVLCGWGLSITALTSIVPDWAAMQPSTACCMSVAGIALLAGARAHANARWTWLRIAAASIVFGLALMTLLQYWLTIDVGIDALFRGKAMAPHTKGIPGRMAMATATNFLLTSAALAILDSGAGKLTQALALSSMGLAALALLGYFYSPASLLGVVFYSTVAFHSALGNLILAVGILLIRPDCGAVAVLVSDSVGGVLARRLLPLAVAAPLLLGWLGVEGQRLGRYDSGFGVALTALAYIALFTVFTWRTAQELRRADLLRADAEEIAHAHRLELSGLVESAMDAIVMLDENHCIVVFNPSAEAMFGQARADVLGRPLDILIPSRFHAQHATQLSGFGGAGATSRRMGSLGSVTAIRADGTEFPAEASISLCHTGAGICYTAIVRDMTDRVGAEKALQASALRERTRAQEFGKLLFAIPAAVCFSYDDPQIGMTGNAVHARWFGDTAAAPPPAGDSPSGQLALQQAAQGQQLHNYAFQHQSPDGSIRYLMGNAMPLCDDGGVPCGAVSVFVDVTELKLAELAMIAVVAGSVAKSNYITHMTHELRTPLSAMLGYSQLLERTLSAPSELAACRHISKAGWHLRDLIAEVQDLATIEAHSAGLASETILIDGMLNDLCGMLKPLLAEAGVRVVLVGTADLTMYANAVRLKQILLNLLSNAIKYNRRGGSIDISRGCDGSSRVKIGIRDGGHGMTATEMAKLFQPFNRLGQELGQQVGTGVGLVVTKKLIESMGGAIGVESDVGHGSLFWFHMPSALRFAPLAAHCQA